MEIDVVDVGWADAGFLHGESDCPCRFLAAFLQADAMKRFASGPVSANLGQNLRPASLRVGEPRPWTL